MAKANDENKRVKAVYMIQQKEGSDESFWTKIGVAFLNKDESLNVHLDAVPVNGKLHIRDFTKKDEKSGASA